LARSKFKMAAILLLFIAGLTCGVAANTGDVQLVRGVELKLQPFYNRNKDFTCLDGSLTIPFSSVNDDYCDCPDGTDEPGTAACPDGRYYCYNIGHKSDYIPSSRVNDGICDCCDGSDEYDSDVVCFNECEKLGEAEKELRKEEQAETIEGSKIRSEYIQSGKEKKEEKLQRIETINGLLEQRRKELEAAQAVKDEAEKPEKEAKDKHTKEWEELKAKKKAEEDSVERNAAFDLLDVDKDGWVAITELLSHKHMANDLKEEEAKILLGGETMVDRESMVNVWEKIKPAFKKEGRPDPANESDGHEEPLPPPASEHTDEEKKEEEEEKGASDEQMPEYDESLKQMIEVADKARSAFDEADKAVRQLENEKKDLDDYMQLDMGTHEEFSALKGECYELTDREYVYKLCPFDRVNQKNKDGGPETNLGTKMTWVDKGTSRYTIMKYEGGAQCWNGPARSTTVYLSCGKENKLTDVNEPSRCEYVMNFKTPSLCEEVPNHDEL